MPGRYTDRARRSVRLAQEHARMMGHADAGTGDLLAGLAAQGERVAAQALAAAGVTAGAFLAGVAVMPAPVPGPLPFTREAAAILRDGAAREARQLGHPWTGTEHLLLAVAGEAEKRPGSAAARILADCDVTPALIRAAVLEILGAYGEVPARGRPRVQADPVAARLDEITRRLDVIMRHPGVPGESG